MTRFRLLNTSMLYQSLAITLWSWGSNLTANGSVDFQCWPRVDIYIYIYIFLKTSFQWILEYLCLGMVELDTFCSFLQLWACVSHTSPYPQKSFSVSFPQSGRQQEVKAISFFLYHPRGLGFQSCSLSLFLMCDYNGLNHTLNNFTVLLLWRFAT